MHAVIEMRELEDVKQVQTLLGMVNYTMKFMPNLSAVTEPLRQIIKQSNEREFVFHFDEVHKEAFQKLKRMMTEAPVLKYYNMDEPITVTCDASQSGIGCALLQGGRPVAYICVESPDRHRICICPNRKRTTRYSVRIFFRSFIHSCMVAMM